MTLVEVMVGVAISGLIVLIAVAFVMHEVKMLGISRNVLEMTQSGRISLDLLGDDLANAGVGVGYDEAGNFGGVSLDQFARGTVQFDSTNSSITLISGAVSTDDIGIVMADGGHSTIVEFTIPNDGTMCAPSRMSVGESVVLRTADGLVSRTAEIAQLTQVTCPGTIVCESSCERFVLLPNSAWQSGGTAPTANYEGGEMAGRFRQVTWFVVEDANGVGHLRRVVGDCADRTTCGDLVADHVESIQMRVYELDPATGWIDRTDALRIDSPNRLRIDVELV